MLDDLNINKKSKVQIDIIENHLLELYYTAIESQRGSMFIKIREMIREKDAEGDKKAVEVLDWALDRLL